MLDKLREDTRVSKLDYRRKLVPDTDIDKECVTPPLIPIFPLSPSSPGLNTTAPLSPP